MVTAKIRLGMLPSRAMTWSLATASSLPTISDTLFGRYFSTHGISGPAAPEEDDDAIDDTVERIFYLQRLRI